MHTRTIQAPIDDVRLLVKGALEIVDDVETYHEASTGTITAKTGFRWGWIASSYGESLTISLRPIDDGKTELRIHGERAVAVNVGAEPDRYVLEFLETLDVLLDYPIDDAVDVLEERTRAGTKEVRSEREQSDSTALVAIVFVVIVLFFLGLMAL